MNHQNHLAFEHWNDVVQAVCGRFTTRRPVPDRPFFGDIRHHALGGLNIADIRTNADAIRHEQGRAARGDDRFYFLVMQRQGSMAVGNDRQQFLLHPGDMALLDSAQTFEMHPLGMINQLSVHLEREAVDRYLPASSHRLCKLSQDSFNSPLLQTLLNQLTAVRLDGTAPDALQHGASLQSVLIRFLEPLLENPAAANAQRNLLRQAQDLIAKTLQDPLRPGELANRLQVSVRQLYRQFEQNGETLQRYTLRLRLERCADDLKAPGKQGVSVAGIACQWGFTDPAYFSRAFKRHFGLTPAAYRTQPKSP